MDYADLDLDVTNVDSTLTILAKHSVTLTGYTKNSPGGGNPNFRVRLTAEDEASLDVIVTRLLDELYSMAREADRFYITGHGQV